MAESLTTKVEAAKDVLDDSPDLCEQTTKFLRMLSAKKCAKTGKLVGLCSDLSERKKTLEYARKEMDSLATAWVISDKESESVWTLASRSSIETEEHCESVVFLNAMLAVMKNPQVSTPAGATLREGLNNVYQTFCHRPELLIPPQWLDEAELLIGSFDSFKESMCVCLCLCRRVPLQCIEAVGRYNKTAVFVSMHVFASSGRVLLFVSSAL